VQQPSWNTLERPSLVEFQDKVWVIGGRLRSGRMNTEIWTMRLADGQAMPPDPGPFVVTPGVSSRHSVLAAVVRRLRAGSSGYLSHG
jgi:hypothetical protein